MSVRKRNIVNIFGFLAKMKELIIEGEFSGKEANILEIGEVIRAKLI